MRKSRVLIIQIAVVLIIGVSNNITFAQENIQETDSLRKDAVRLFMDCMFCDMNYIRNEISYVNYVRDVKEAQVYVLVTSQNTGSGGREYTLSFLGQNGFKGMNDTLIYVSRPDDTRDHTREGRTNMLKMGLMRYVAKTPIYKEVQIRHRGGSAPEEVVDRWNNWVFEAETRPRFNVESSYSRIDVRNSISAVKITPDWKIEMDFDHSFTRTTYKRDDTTYTADRISKGLDNLIVKSLGEHWSVGARIDISSSTYSNLKFNYEIYPSIEYNLFPYSESTHHQLRFLYGIGYSYNDYQDTTIFNKISESLFEQQLRIAYQVQEKWGSVNVSLDGSNYFHDLKKNELELEGSIRIRIIKGLSFNINGSIARVHNQLSLKKEEASEQAQLLRLQELATDYKIEGGLSITYTFGSIYNNIVNPRFGNGGGGYGRYFF